MIENNPQDERRIPSNSELWDEMGQKIHDAVKKDIPAEAWRIVDVSKGDLASSLCAQAIHDGNLYELRVPFDSHIMGPTGQQYEVSVYRADNRGQAIFRDRDSDYGQSLAQELFYFANNKGQLLDQARAIKSATPEAKASHYLETLDARIATLNWKTLGVENDKAGSYTAQDDQMGYEVTIKREFRAKIGDTKFFDYDLSVATLAQADPISKSLTGNKLEALYEQVAALAKK